MILQDQALAPAVETLFERIIRYLNTPFIEQKGFSVSIVSLILLVLVICVAALISRYGRRFLQKRVLARFHIDTGLQYTLLRLAHYLIITLGVLYVVEGRFHRRPDQRSGHSRVSFSRYWLWASVHCRGHCLRVHSVV